MELNIIIVIQIVLVIIYIIFQVKRNAIKNAQKKRNIIIQGPINVFQNVQIIIIMNKTALNVK